MGSRSEQSEQVDPLDQPNVNELRRLYGIFCAGPLKTFESAWDDFAKLCREPGVAKINIVDNDEGVLVLVIGTEVIRLFHNAIGEWYEIGEFSIVMQRTPTPSVSYFNQSRQQGGYHHPHVSNVGQLCSDVSSLITQNVGAGKIVPAVHLAILALNTYGVPFGSASLEKWPLAKDLRE